MVCEIKEKSKIYTFIYNNKSATVEQGSAALASIGHYGELVALSLHTYT